MKSGYSWACLVRLSAFACLFTALYGGAATAQIVEKPGFSALPRPINYATALTPAGKSHAIIVYGKSAPWTRKGALAVQKAVLEWSGKRLEIADDWTVTSNETWLLNDSYRKIPLIVLGNAQDNRVMHALGTRFLLQSNRTWPGGDRHIIRTVFEPFIADVNYIILEASTADGMDGAAAKFAELLKTFPKDATATIPITRVVSGVKDKWKQASIHWKIPQEWQNTLERSASELARSYKGKPIPAGWASHRGPGFVGEIYEHMLGGTQGPRGEDPTAVNLDPGRQRATAAMFLLGCRALGGRAYLGFDHYGVVPYLCGMWGVFQSGVLTAEEFNELESALTLCAAHPDNGVYDNVAAGDRLIRNRHTKACLLNAVVNQDYVLYHCRMDEPTRKEVERRYDGTHKTAAQYVRSFRDPCEDSCLGETTMLQFYALLHQGLLENVRNGTLKRSADMYILTTDNIDSGWGWGCYPGLAGFTSAPGGMTKTWLGGSLVTAAAFYYDDPQYRWFVRNRSMPQHSEASGMMGMHSPMDTVGKTAEPARYLGVRALPFDEKIFGLLEDRVLLRNGGIEARLAPEPLAKAIDRVAFRDGFAPKDAYMFLATSEDIPTRYPAQNNSIARFTDLGDIWLYTNTTDGTTWARSAVSVSNGKSFIPRAGCTLEALTNLGDVSAVASREQAVGGADWTRTIVHWRGHYFAVLDRMEARQDDEFIYVCRWRSTQSAALADGVWTATALSANTLRIQNTEPLFQTAEYWECDGSGRPYVLQQYKQAKLSKGQAQTYQNLLYVSGRERPDEFQARQVNPRAMLVKGRTKDGEHLALIGTGGAMPLAGFETDAAIYDVMGDRLHLAGLTVLKAKTAQTMREIFWAEKPVNLLVDCDTGKGEIEAPGDQPVQVRIAGEATSWNPRSKALTLAQSDVLPKPSGLLETLWNQSKSPSAQTPEKRVDLAPVFETKSAAESLQRPLRRINLARVTSTPPPSGQRDNARTWNDTANLEILLTFPQPTPVGCLRLLGNIKRADSDFRSAGKAYEAGDFKFSLTLSDDNFQKDVRKIENPKVTWEETAQISVGHYVMTRLPTWRIEVGATAKQVKLLPRATNKEQAKLSTADLEVYGAERVDEMAAKVFAADINGDGSNELVVGTSEKEMAAYDAEGARLWKKNCPGDILQMCAADLDEDGKAETLAYLTTEKLLRINGDGTERPGGDIYKAQLETRNGVAGIAVAAMAAWGPDGAANKEVWLWAEPSYRVLADGTVKLLSEPAPTAAGRLANLYPNEPEVLATVASQDMALWSARRDKDGKHVLLGGKPLTGFNASTSAAGIYLGFSCVQPVNAGRFKGLLAAIGGGLNWYPIDAFLPGSKAEGWKFNTGGPPVKGVLAEDINGDGVPEVFLARLDGFVNVFNLTDGKTLGLLNTAEPILGMCMLRNKEGKPCLAVGTRFAVHLFGADLKPIGRQTMPTAAFAGPGGKERDRAYVVDPAGKVMILTVR